MQSDRRWANRLAERADRSRVLPITVLSLLYLAVTVVLAQRKLMWNDELYTYYMARLPSMSDVWAALMSRGEQTPPFFYLTTRVSFDLFGVNNLSVRLPEILGFWVMLASLYVFVARRASSLSGAVRSGLSARHDRLFVRLRGAALRTPARVRRIGARVMAVGHPESRQVDRPRLSRWRASQPRCPRIITVCSSYCRLPSAKAC